METEKSRYPESSTPSSESSVRLDKGKSILSREEHFGDKYGNWSLTPTRPVLIIGDSNISCLPIIDDDRIQMVSYPGAQLAHAYHLLKHKTGSTEEVQRSFYLSDLIIEITTTPHYSKKLSAVSQE